MKSGTNHGLIDLLNFAVKFRWNTALFIFLLAEHKVDFIAPCKATKSISWPPSREKNCVRYGKNINFTRVVIILALFGHQTSDSQNFFFSSSCTIFYFRIINFFNPKGFLVLNIFRKVYKRGADVFNHFCGKDAFGKFGCIILFIFHKNNELD